jgi:phosphoglycolate phosphatase-like HAD superfamily hydrolase
MLRVITDFDGLILDLSERYYTVYQFCLTQIKRPDQPVKPLSKSEFWDLKRSRIPETQVAIASGLDEEQAIAFKQLRDRTAHTHPYFQLDTLIPGVIPALETLQDAGADIVAMTLRRTSELAFGLEQHALTQFYPENRRYALADDYPKAADLDDKPLLMAQALQELPSASQTWMVGDTEADIAAAKAHQIPVIAVLSGIRNYEQLLYCQPDHIVADLAAAIRVILSSNCV